MKNTIITTIFILLICPLIGYAQDNAVTVTGKVLDEYKLPMAGVTVKVKNENVAVMTDNVGNYSIKTATNKTLQFSFLGFETIEETVNSRNSISIEMIPVSIDFEEVVVVGYGKQRKLDMTGSIASMNAEELTKLPVANVLEALSGKMAGVQVVGESEPGAAPTLRIRGVGSYGETAPICVIDGQFFEISELSSINPNDIESVTVLKDASSTAIYGSRGANGVIIVTTKQGSGEKGKVRVNAGVYTSLSKMERHLPTANISQWQQIENLSFLADNWKDAAAKDKLPYPDWQTADKGTDWQKLVSRTALTQNYNVSIGGSSDKTDYYIAATLLDQEGVIKYSDYKRFTGKANASYRPYKWLKLGINSTFIQDDQVVLDRNVLSLAGRRLSSAPVFNNEEDGESEDNFNGGDSNPYALLYYTHDRYNKSWKYLNNVYAEVSFLKKLILRSSISLTNVSREEKVFLPAFMEKVATSTSEYKVSRFQHNNNSVNSWLQENTLTYDLVKDKHRMTAMGGFTLQSERTQFARLSANELPWSAWKNRNLWYVGQGKNISGNDGGSEKTYASFLARVNYTFDDKYTMTLTGRVDGSSAYPSDKKYGFFPAVGFGWIMNEENFLKDKKWLDMFKLKASYGVVGNDRGVSAAQMLYADAMDVVMGSDNEVIKADALRLMIDNSLSWEESRTLNTGFEMSVLKNLLRVNFEYYNKTTSRVMMPLNIPPSNIKVISNIGKVRNQGVEVTVNYTPKIGNVKTSFLFTATTVDNKVIEINRNIGPISSLPNMTLDGYPIGSLWGLKTLGVFQNEEQLAQLPKADGTRVGDLIFWDRDGNGLIDNADNVYLGSYLPKTYLGFTSSATFKNFTLNVELQSALGHKSFNRRMQFRQPAQNYMTDMLDAWHGEGTTNTHPRVFSRSDASAAMSDYFIENCDYLSLANIQLAYNFPRKTLKKIGVNNLKIYINGGNLYTWTAATGYKPDVAPRGNNANSGGLDDFGLYPNNRTYTAGLSFNF